MTDLIHDRISIDVKDQIATVHLNRPEKHNALDMAMFYGIDKTIKTLAGRKDVRVIIVAGRGESFCSGLDIKSVMNSQKNGLKLLWKWWPGSPNLAQKVTIGWRRLKVPVIMVLHGKCWGGGMQIALGGDFRIAHPETTLAVMEARWGLIPDMGGTPALKENMAQDQAMRLAMTAEEITAKQAMDCNLISEISDAPMGAALSLAEKLKQRSPDTNRAIKKIYHKAWSRDESRLLAAETFNQWKILFGYNRKIAVKKALGDTSAKYR